MSKRVLFMINAVIVLAMTACNAFGPELGRERGQIGNREAPLPTNSERQVDFPSDLTPFYYGDLSFAYDATQINPLITTERIPAQRGPVLDFRGELRYFEGIPDFTVVHFHTDHTIERTTSLLVLPIRDENGEFYADYDQELIDYWEGIETRLETGEVTRQFNEAKIEIIPFRNGQGMRRLVQGETFGPEPLTTENLFYQFDGFTDDGRWAVRLRYPAFVPVVNPPEMLSDEEIDTAFRDYVTYATQMFELIEQLEMSRVQPDFEVLDQMVSTLTAEVPEEITEVDADAQLGYRYDYDLRDDLYQTIWQIQWYALDPNSNADPAVGEAFLREEVEITTETITFQDESCPYSRFHYDYPDAAEYLANEHQVTAEYLEIEPGFVEVIKNTCRFDTWAEMFKGQNSWDGGDVLIAHHEGVFLYMTRKDGKSFTLQPTNAEE
ncbi:MAG TPA: hypothetical protein VLL52_24460 [Anaerolineae bacterium]|nr:hypothetical protein [Anaerolineae bacterium]